MKRYSFLGSLLLFPFVKVFGKSRSPRSEVCKTQSDQEGPYYKGGAPLRTVIEREGEQLTIQGVIVKSSDCTTPVPGAVVDIWHCDTKGHYDNDGFKCRGLVKSNESGEYSFTTIYPPSYGSRPRHIHIKVRAEGFQELTSQIYFKGDKNLQNNFARNASTSRIISLRKIQNVLNGQFDIYL